MPTLNIKITGIEEALKVLDPRKVQRAASSALKRVVQGAKTETSSAVRDIYNIKKKDLDNRISVSPVNRDELTATLEISGKGKKIGEGADKGQAGISLAYFGARQIKGTKQAVPVRTHTRTSNLFGRGIRTFTVPQYQHRILKGGGVSAQIFTGGQKTFRKGAFLSKMGSGHIGVMRRSSNQKMRSKNKPAIKEISMVSLPTMFLNVKVRGFDRVAERVGAQWPKEFSHALEREFAK